MHGTIFNDQMFVDVATGETMKVVALRKGFAAAIPESQTWAKNDDFAVILANMILILGRTKRLEVADPVTADPVICDLFDWWQFASNSNDYRAIWNAFMMLDLSVNNEFVELLNKADNSSLKAPKDIQPSAPSDEQLEVSEDGLKG